MFQNKITEQKIKHVFNLIKKFNRIPCCCLLRYRHHPYHQHHLYRNRSGYRSSSSSPSSSSGIPHSPSVGGLASPSNQRNLYSPSCRIHRSVGISFGGPGQWENLRTLSILFVRLIFCF